VSAFGGEGARATLSRGLAPWRAAGSRLVECPGSVKLVDHTRDAMVGLRH
jgi:hypothetical protein